MGARGGARRRNANRRGRMQMADDDDSGNNKYSEVLLLDHLWEHLQFQLFSLMKTIFIMVDAVPEPANFRHY